MILKFEFFLIIFLILIQIYNYAIFHSHFAFKNKLIYQKIKTFFKF